MDFRYGLALIAVVFALILASGYIYSDGISRTGHAGSVISEQYDNLPVLSSSEVKSIGIEVAYVKLINNIENYVGKIIRYHGKVVEITSYQDNFYSLHLATRKNAADEYQDDVIFVNFKEYSFSAGDLIEVWGMVVGLETYTSISGEEITIPGIFALHIEPYAEL